MSISKVVSYVYAYGTDFVINVANITGLSYYEVNAIIFCIFWPVVTLGIGFMYLHLRYRLYVAEMKDQRKQI